MNQDSQSHRATPEQWATHKAWAASDDDSSCLLELRSRIEALEAAQQDKLDRLIALDRDDPTPDAAMTELRAASAEVRPAGLVERVAETMATPSLPAREWRDESCAVIRAVAAWLRKQGGYPNEWTAQMLEQEADRG
jgi:hypothetical protein